jgi:hypothetical protein
MLGRDFGFITDCRELAVTATIMTNQDPDVSVSYVAGEVAILGLLG